MPKRIVDGEGVWHSRKLALVEPPAFRAEYCNLLPLALANGSFECDPKLIWSTCYAYNRPDITIDFVVNILDEFERVRLLFRWLADGKPWAYWVGIDKPGRLPPASRIQRSHVVCGKLPPSEQLEHFLLDASFITDEEPMVSHELAIGEPVVALGSGSGSGSGACASINIRANPHSEKANQWVANGQPSQTLHSVPFDCRAAADWVCLQLSYSGYMHRVIEEVIELERRKSDLDIQEIAEGLVRCRKSYETVPHKAGVYSPRSFFEQGHYRNSKQWGASNGRESASERHKREIGEIVQRAIDGETGNPADDDAGAVPGE
jgi:hypothetical protein